jgi:hypothetical protein
MSTVLDLLTNALAEIGVASPGEDPSAADAAFALSKLNRLTSTWATRKTLIHAILPTRHTVITAKGSYTIGPTGADITAARPAWLQTANLIPVGTSPENRTHLAILDDDEFAGMSVVDLSSSTPYAIYNDRNAPNATLYVIGYPAVGDVLELFFPQPVTQFTDLVTVLALPQGYEEALTLTLAEGLCVPYGKTLSRELVEMARRARAAIQGLNSAAPKISTIDGGMPGSERGSWFDINTRTYR